MLSELFDSAPPRDGWRRIAPWAGATTLTHCVLVAVLLAGWVGFDTSTAQTPPEVTYLELEAMEPEPLPPEPEPPAPPPEPEFTPEPPPEPPPEERPAGFQELEVPPEVVGIPDEVATDSVRAADFAGRGAVGGVADGVRGNGPVATSASELRTEERRPLVVDDAFVTEPPVLLDVERVSQQMAELYPRALLDMRLGGTVIAHFMVLENGRVDPSTILIVQAEHPLLADATRRAVRTMRFRPGRMLWDGTLQPVRVRTTMPLNWTLR